MSKRGIAISFILVVVIVSLSWLIASTFYLNKSLQIRVQVPNTLIGIFQIEGMSSQPTANSIQNNVNGLTIIVPQGKRYVGLKHTSPFVEWHDLQFVDESGNAIPSGIDFDNARHDL